MNAHRSEFSYDGQWRRVRVTEIESGVTNANAFLWIGSALAEMRDTDGSTVQRHFAGAGERVIGTNYFYTRDHLGSVREMLDGANSLRARYNFAPYGERIRTDGSLDASFGFTGHFAHPSSGLHLALFRGYDTASARWINRDPLGEAGGLNAFSYVQGNPLNYVDPFGLEQFDWHHIFVRELRPFFEEAGIDIDAPENGWMLPREIHTELHARQYSEQWKQFFDYGRKKRNSTEIRRFARHLAQGEFKPFFLTGKPASGRFGSAAAKRFMVGAGVLALVLQVANAQETGCRVLMDTMMYANDRNAGRDAWAIVDALDARHTLNQQALFSGDIYMRGLLQ